MPKRLTKILEDNKDNLEKIAEELTEEKYPILKSRDYDFSSPEALERIEKVHETQRRIRKSAYCSKYDLDKASAPYSRPYSH